ncbi:hypothetical protein Tco_0220740, partial [Tanacetum coccineum]
MSGDFLIESKEMLPLPSLSMFMRLSIWLENQRHEAAKAYAVAPVEGKGYQGNVPLCNRCNLHHNGQCPPKCKKCRREAGKTNKETTATATTPTTSRKTKGMKLPKLMLFPQLREKVIKGTYHYATDVICITMVSALLSAKNVRELVIKKRTIELGLQQQVATPNRMGHVMGVQKRGTIETSSLRERTNRMK